MFITFEDMHIKKVNPGLQFGCSNQNIWYDNTYPRNLKADSQVGRPDDF